MFIIYVKEKKAKGDKRNSNYMELKKRKMKVDKNNPCSMSVLCRKHPFLQPKQPRVPPTAWLRYWCQAMTVPHIPLPGAFAAFAGGCAS